MKFFNTVFALIAASAIYANEADIAMKYLSKNALNVSYDDLPETMPGATGSSDDMEKCKVELQQYQECIDDPTPSTLDTYCPKFLSDNCQKFYKDPMGLIPSCKSTGLIDINFGEIVNTVLPVYKLACQKDEVGNPCPFSDVVIKSFTFLNATTLKDKLETSCRSDLCREATINAFASETEFSITGKKEKQEFLKSDECKNISSGATSLKVRSGLLISIGLLLLSLY
ncbi:hypothetical protein PIROE2DRAFT_57880 [Piromyces sp. E2]|nr:hypothetical protein PIROE2DRAFT_57880 [Piromyces sp. E2]|eukprot:OUM68797.1 hypothetical protein PIROE2DRAFT_57880 [Piromyces sp. E2]